MPLTASKRLVIGAQRYTRCFGELQAMLRTEKNPKKQVRLRIVLGMLEGALTAAQIAKRFRVSRATVYVNWRCYRLRGLEGLQRRRRVGRPQIDMPAVVRRRFAHLNNPEIVKQGAFIYIAQREQQVFRILGLRFPIWKITRWLRVYLASIRFKGPVLRLRSMRQAWSRFTYDYKLRYIDLSSEWKRHKADILHCASKLIPTDRGLFRRALAAWFAVPVSEVAFPGEPKHGTAQVCWNTCSPDEDSNPDSWDVNYIPEVEFEATLTRQAFDLRGSIRKTFGVSDDQVLVSIR